MNQNNEILLSTKVRAKVPPRELWAFLSDTDRLNKSIGLSPSLLAPWPDPEKKGHLEINLRYMGIKFAYEEYPFDFVKERRYEIRRVFKDGFFRYVIGGIRIAPDSAGTELEVYARVSPKNPFTTFLSKILLRGRLIGDVARLSKEFDEQYIAAPREVLDHLVPNTPADQEQLSARISKLAQTNVEADLIPRFEKYLKTAPDVDVVAIRPFELAEIWGVNRMEALRLCLHATKLGLLNLHWLVLCPNCRAPSTDALTLSKLKSEAHCDTCRVKYDADLADSVEVRFSVHPSVRAARREVYCIGGPSNMPQVLAQLRLAPGEARKEPILLKPGVIRIRCYQAEGIYSINVTDAATASASPRIDCYSTGLSIDAKELRAGEVEFSVTNNLIGEALIVIESETWRESAATATTVISLQDFRDLFPAEAVAPGEEISISSLTLLFTDLKGSTMLYNRVGDAQAFGLVQNHFRFLTEYIMQNYGGIYKTMGDAVMASFSRNIDATRAAVEMQKRWNGFMKEFGGENPLLLKVGIHQGQAIAINNNGRLDCFGTTVNIASHIQKVSVGGDIVVSEQVFDDPEVAKFIESASSGFNAERIECSLKGYADRKFKLVKLTSMVG